MNWPSGEVLRALMIAEGHVTSDRFPLDFYQRKVDAAIARWEALTGWFPYQSTGVSSTKYLNPNATNLLILPSGILTLTSLVVNDVTMTENTDFWLQGDDGIYPNYYVRFSGDIRGLPKTIAVTGTWGFDTLVDVIAYDAVIDYATARVLEALYGEGGAASEKRQGSLTVRYQGTTGTMEGQTKAEVLDGQFLDAVALRQKFGVALGNGH